MSLEDSVRILLGRAADGQVPLDLAEWKRVKARVAWVRETMAKWREALHHQMERCMASVEKLSDEEFERLCDEEQAKVDTIRAELDAVIEHDRWPRHLYFGGL